MRINGFIGIVTFLTSIILGLIVAQFNPNGFNIIENDISDLGSSNHTPIPLFLDFGAMSMGLLLIPMVLYINKLLTPSSLDDDKAKWVRISISFHKSLGTIGLIFGLIGLFGLGLFSKDRTTELHLHANFALLCFIGIISGGFFIGQAIILNHKVIPRTLGIYMIFIPPFPFFLLMWLIPIIIIISREIDALTPSS